MLSSLALLALLPASSFVRAQVTAVAPNGITNPPAPFLAEAGAVVNATSDSRLVTVNSIDDFCLFGPPEAGPDSLIGNVEPTVVAYCTKHRNGARLIPDGTIYSAHFIKTPLYVQIQGFFDGTKINIPYGDSGGELDPHGAENLGNPIGGNVTSNVSGADVFYEEWMSFMSYDQFCIRICTAETADVSAALQCEHELDIMGCQFVMPGDYTNNSFTSCDGEPAAPPGLYPLPGGGTSTFRQAFTYTAGTQIITLGQTVTPAAPFSTPATSNCVSTSTIANGIAVATTSAAAAASSGSARVSTSGTRGASAANSQASATGTGAAASGSAASTGSTGAGVKVVGASQGGLVGLLLTFGVVVVGGFAVLI
ncbi:hypothetical protein BDY24DRAFT_363153 [Mrakia frigida]|uniref:uncharacterized protein n=1 Tax=Mrakia frigida TaxID=29902 RepID=UPI003FCBF78C